MRAVQFSSYGTPEVLKTVEVDAPHAGPGEIVIQVASAGINPLDAKVRSGSMAAGRPGSFPSGTGFDAAGTVIEVGAGVEDIALGDVAFGIGHATVAERAVLTQWATLPDSVDPVEAGGWGVAVKTAGRLLAELALEDGTLLVSGASGGVGSAVVQLAVGRGLKVIGTASERNLSYLTSLGATALTYGPGLVERVSRAAPEGIGGALDISGAGVIGDLVTLVGDPAKVISIADFTADSFGARFSRGGGNSTEYRDAFAEALSLPHFGLNIEQTYSLDEASAAHGHIEGGHTVGKLVVLPESARRLISINESTRKKEVLMHNTKLQERAAKRTQELPGAELTHPFGEGWDVFKVRDKVFMLQTAVTGEPIVILKAAPADGRSLRDAHADITPGYHMNKQHWITLHPDGELDAGLVDELVTESYLLVVENLPKQDQPVDPATFGKRS